MYYVNQSRTWVPPSQAVTTTGWSLPIQIVSASTGLVMATVVPIKKSSSEK